MRVRGIVLTTACAGAMALPAAASAAHSVGTSEQIAWVRHAATRFVTAELSRNATEACAVLNAPLRATRADRTCEQRWSGKIASMLRTPGVRAELRMDRRAIATAAVVVQGNTASIELPTPLLKGSDELVWTEMCWMVKG